MVEHVQGESNWAFISDLYMWIVIEGLYMSSSYLFTHHKSHHINCSPLIISFMIKTCTLSSFLPLLYLYFLVYVCVCISSIDVDHFEILQASGITFVNRTWNWMKLCIQLSRLSSPTRWYNVQERVLIFTLEWWCWWALELFSSF